jgi:hypothetical protein
MVSYDTNVRISEILKGIQQVIDRVDQLIELMKPDQDLWDNANIIKYWKVSERTLADWRRKGLISFVQVNGKIWYPRSSREGFLQRNLINVKDGGK